MTISINTIKFWETYMSFETLVLINASTSIIWEEYLIINMNYWLLIILHTNSYDDE